MLGLVLGCSAPPSEKAAGLTAEQLKDPEACASCHPQHYEEWSGSMHAYAAEDPIFLAMNARAQRDDKLGDFCVKCHAPMAVRDGLTQDGLNLPALPQSAKGVTCYFCHSAERVEGVHDNPIVLATDKALRGPLSDPLANPAHASSYTRLLDRDSLESAAFCGSCHDIRSAHGTDLERTFQEWQASAFSQAPGGTTCGQCHMAQSKALEPVASLAAAPPRRRHAHDFPAVDQALTEFPHAAEQRASAERLLATTLQTALCVRGLGAQQSLLVVFDNVAAGHAWPSGVAQDRRAWVQLQAYQAGQLIYESGASGTNQTTPDLPDPDLWLLRDCGFDQNAEPVAMFWQARSIQSTALPAQLTFDQADRRFYQTHVYRSFPRSGALSRAPDSVTLRMHLAPVGVDVADDLIENGDLDAGLRDSLVALEVGEPLTWTAATATEVYQDKGIPMSCISASNLRASADRVPASDVQACSH
ncbi:MAG TPA: multiheme c-type cytochrome [Polyangiaceae bacterium]|nr:multiheme c-type cytochrome [Polyangiaceae bacterium]